MKQRGLLVLVGAAVAMGAMHALEKRGIETGADPSAFAFLRSLAALLFVALVWGIWRRDEGKQILDRRNLQRMAHVGVIASGIVLLLGILALETTEATNKGVITALYPLATAAFAWWLYGRRPGPKSGLALGLVVTGLVLLTSRGFVGAPRTGDWLMLATVPLVGFADAYAKRILEGVSPLTLTLGRYFFGVLFLALAFAVRGIGEVETLSPAWPWAVGAGLAAGLGIVGLYTGIEARGPTPAALVVSAAPIVTLLLDGIWLQTHPGLPAILGTLVAVGGIVLFEAVGDKKP